MRGRGRLPAPPVPAPVRAGGAGARAARAADIVYATATYAAAAAAAVAARRPLVVKLVSDPRTSGRCGTGLFAGTLEEFQRAEGATVRPLKAARSLALRRAATVVVPSTYLAEIARSWGLAGERVHVLTNPAPPPTPVVPERHEPNTFVFVGRLTAQKDLGVAIEAIARVPAARLVIVGDGPERDALERLAASSAAADRVQFRGSRTETTRCAQLQVPQPRCLSSAWENLHAAVEALSVGRRSSPPPSAACPRSCGTDRTGCSCNRATPRRSPARSAGSSTSPGCAIAWPRRRRRLSQRSRAMTCTEFRGNPGGGRPVSPHKVLVGRGRIRLPLSPDLARKWDAVGEQLDYRILGAAEDGKSELCPSDFDSRLHSVLTGSTGSCSLLLPLRVRDQLREFRPDAVVAADPFVGAAVMAGRRFVSARARNRGGARRLADVYAALRLLLAQAARARRRRWRRGCCVAPTRPGRSPASRPAWSNKPGAGPADASFATYSDLSAFKANPIADLARTADRPVRRDARGVQEHRRARRRVAPCRRGDAGGTPRDRWTRLPSGGGREARARLARERRARRPAAAGGVAARLDDGLVLVLPSWPEGLGRVVIEAFARGGRCGDGGRRRARPRRGRARRSTRPTGRRGCARRGVARGAPRP